jgi:hypothetical protein
MLVNWTTINDFLHMLMELMQRAELCDTPSNPPVDYMHGITLLRSSGNTVAYYTNERVRTRTRQNPTSGHAKLSGFRPVTTSFRRTSCDERATPSNSPKHCLVPR